MKKMTMLKSIATVALFTVVGMSASAQVTVVNPQIVARPVYDAAYYSNPTNYTTTGTETATVGAQMPYYVIRDANVNGTLFNASTFVWTGTGITALSDLSLTNSITSGGPAVSYNNIVATMPAATGSVTLKTQEQSNPKVGTGCLDATGTTLSITVVAKPTFTLPTTDMGGCGTSASYDISSALTGTAPFYVDYTITGVDINSATIGAPAGESYSATVTTADAGVLKIDPTQLAHLGGVATVGATISGKYTVTINKVWDSVSYKALNSSSLSTTTPVSGSSAIAILVYPTPQTKAIQFIKVQ